MFNMQNLSIKDRAALVGVAFLVLTSLAGNGILYVRGKNTSLALAKVSSELETKAASMQNIQVRLSEEATAKNKAIEEREEAVNVGAQLYLKQQALLNALGKLGGIIESLDTLILADDNRNVEIVNWYSDNALFYQDNGNLADANFRYARWLEKQKESTREYNRIKAAFTTAIDQAMAEANAINELDFNSLKESDPSVN